MTPAELLAEVTAAGLRVDLTDDGSLYVQPRERVTPDMIERLKAAKSELVAHLRRQRLADLAAERLREHPELKRATVIEPDGPGRFIAAVAVPCLGHVVTAILSGIRADDELQLLHAFDRACEAGLQ